jgi:hypothetical protein
MSLGELSWDYPEPHIIEHPDSEDEADGSVRREDFRLSGSKMSERCCGRVAIMSAQILQQENLPVFRRNSKADFRCSRQ